MRETEFRAKRKDNDEWIYGDLLQPTELCNTYEISDKNTIDGSRYDVDKETIGQYTGLKDKNGKKIFEGDIVKAFYYETEVIGKIEFIYGTFALTNSGISDNQLFIFEKLEVIGNIYDNPDLLKEEI